MGLREAVLAVVGAPGCWERLSTPSPWLIKRRQRLARGVSRKQTGSANRRKARGRLARLDARIANVRTDSLHPLTTDLTRRFDTIGIEDLNVRGMMANRHLARAVGDAGLGEFRRQLEYKAPMRGGQVVVADRWFPSSKMCSACGERLPLSVRQWACSACRSAHDRDVNAAVNLKNHAVRSTVKACGEAGAGRGSGIRHIVPVKPASAKQEVSFGYVQAYSSRSDGTVHAGRFSDCFSAPRGVFAWCGGHVRHRFVAHAQQQFGRRTSFSRTVCRWGSTP